MARGRWRYDEATGEVVESEAAPVPPPPPVLDPEEERRKREREERDEHPGNYL